MSRATFCAGLAATLGVLFAAVALGQEAAPPPTTTDPPPAAAAAPAAASAPAAPQYSRKGADSCIACHDDTHVLSLFKTPHGRQMDGRSPFGAGNLQCEACHGPGGEHAARVRSGQERPPIPHFGAVEPASAKAGNEMCLACHRPDMTHGWQGSAHQREDVSCTSCHQLHAVSDPVRTDAGQAQVCETCHQSVKSQSRLPFSHPLRQGQLACSGCHEPHGSATDFSLVKQSLNDTCYACHAEKRGPFLWEHAPVTEDCSLCHKPHGSTQPALLTQRAPLLCQQCHSQAGHPSVPLTAQGLPGANPSALFLGSGCLNCHSQVHGSNHPSGAKLMR